MKRIDKIKEQLALDMPDDLKLYQPKDNAPDDKGSTYKT